MLLRLLFAIGVIIGLMLPTPSNAMADSGMHCVTGTVSTGDGSQSYTYCWWWEGFGGGGGGGGYSNPDLPPSGGGGTYISAACRQLRTGRPENCGDANPGTADDTPRATTSLDQFEPHPNVRSALVEPFNLLYGCTAVSVDPTTPFRVAPWKFVSSSRLRATTRIAGACSTFWRRCKRCLMSAVSSRAQRPIRLLFHRNLPFLEARSFPSGFAR